MKSTENSTRTYPAKRYTTTPQNSRTEHLVQNLHSNCQGDDKQKGRQYEKSEKQLSDKGQDKNKQKPLNDEEIGNLPGKEFRVMIIKMIQDLGKRMETQMENAKEILTKS